MAKKNNNNKKQLKSIKKKYEDDNQSEEQQSEEQQSEQSEEQQSEQSEEQQSEQSEERSDRSNKKTTKTKKKSDKTKQISPKPIKLAEKTKEFLKKKITDWLDNDDKIKNLNSKIKKYKDAKKSQEENIIKFITKLGMEESKIDVEDENQQLRSRVYRHKSITKGAIKEDIIKDALMEAIRNEKKVDQLVKKIESKRPLNERYYLKRTKGNK